MADENKNSVLDEQSTQKAGASWKISSIVLLLGIVTLAMAVLIALLGRFVQNFDVMNILTCITYVVYAVTLAVYLIDAIKFKNFALNPALIILIIATIMMF